MNKKITSIVAIVAALSVVVITNIDSFSTSSDKGEKYIIKKWESTYINSTGDKVKDNKISLSNSYWEGGKFSF
jgi:hypothetical protein